MSAFQPSLEQVAALKTVEALQKQPHDKPRVMVLRGYAGTGKTTILRILAQEQGELAIIAPTGKAALRVTEATMLGAMTVHRFIYEPKEDPISGEVRFLPKDLEDILKPESGLIVIEEASMVNLKMWEDIYAVAKGLGCHIIAVGDPFQLPPVEERGASVEKFGLLDPAFNFDFEANLTQVHRQALENPIIRASMMLREGDAADAMMLLPRIKMAALLDKHLEILADQGVVICHKNATRFELNRRIRAHKKFPEFTLQDREPLLVLRNNYQLQRFNGEVLTFNGWEKPPGKRWEIYDRWKDTVDHSTFGLANVEGDKVALSPQSIFGKLQKVSVNAVEQVARTAVGKDIPLLTADLGYTLTCHKSQGSEWKQVLVVVERSVQPNTRDGRRWLYTAVTRAKEKVNIVWIAAWNDTQIT